MTNWTEAADLLDERAQPGYLARVGPGALAFLLSAALGVWLIYFRPLTQATTHEQIAKSETNPFGALAPVAPARPAEQRTAANPFGEMVLNGFGSDARFDLAEREIPLPPVAPSDLRTSDDGVPLPPRRPNELARPSADVARPSAPVATPTPQAGPGLIERLFGKAPSTPASTPDTKLAYAAPPPASAGVSATISGRGGANPGGFGGFLRGLNFGSSNPTARFGDRVAVYDISARVVYLPDGTKIEAHSGLGSSRDDPSKVNERMRGPTPPATYALTPRGELFHGVAALRLTPIDGNIFGRAGLLAHTYMLGPDGDSNGCVSFRDYDAFLRAYRNGEVTKLVVVTRL